MNFVQAQPGSPFAAAAAKAKKAEEEANFTNSAISSEEPMKMSMSALSSPKGNQSVSKFTKRKRASAIAYMEGTVIIVLVIFIN